MRILEKILAGLFVLGLAGKLMLIPGSDYLTMRFLFGLTVLYFPLGVLLLNRIPLLKAFNRNSYKGLSPLRIMLSIFFGLGLAAICNGVSSKLLIWDRANEQIIVGLFLVSAATIWEVIFEKMNKLGESFFLKRSIIGGIVGLIFLLTPVTTIIKIQYRHHPDYVKAYIDYLSDPDDEEKKKRKEAEYYRIVLPEEWFKRQYPNYPDSL